MDPEEPTVVDDGTHRAYHFGEWCIVVTIEQADYFETDPESYFVIYAQIRRGGEDLGRVDIVTGIEIREDTLCLTDMHIHGLTPGLIGRAGLNALAHAAMEEANVDTLVIEGGHRTTGARPGERPRPVRFCRRPGVDRGA